MPKKEKDLGGTYPKGRAFVDEKTGSATMINVDGEWEHDFVDDNTPAPDFEEKKN
ncbi:hypothetical protein [Desulfofalx alkaliphila]|uniref:hypothetical protein n=1 Tax=Desulfofalx alkaliphila TaxID=105483 RepID=UPI000AA5316E|nr:hypothetical protein [Desulfofalx alkaliphila]